MTRKLTIPLPFLALMLGAFVACGGGTPDRQPVKEPRIIGGGGAEPFYEEPLLLVPGEYVPPWQANGTIESEAALEAAASRKPQLSGTVNGFRLYGFKATFSNPGIEKKRCAGGKIDRFELASEMAFDYLPPGTSAITPQFAGVCPDGATAFVMQELTTSNTSFDVIYEAGARAFAHDASADRVTAATVGGRRAVVVRPLTEDGLGRSWVAVATPSGLFLIDARRLPLDQTLKIAEGIRCADC